MGFEICIYKKKILLIIKFKDFFDMWTTPYECFQVYLELYDFKLNFIQAQFYQRIQLEV